MMRLLLVVEKLAQLGQSFVVSRRIALLTFAASSRLRPASSTVSRPSRIMATSSRFKLIWSGSSTNGSATPNDHARLVAAEGA
jgi:hypothetical protein